MNTQDEELGAQPATVVAVDELTPQPQITGLGLDDLEIAGVLQEAQEMFEDLAEAYQVEHSLESLLENILQCSNEGMTAQGLVFANTHFHGIQRQCGVEDIGLESYDTPALESNVRDFIEMVKKAIKRIIERVTALFTKSSLIMSRRVTGLEESTQALLERVKKQGKTGLGASNTVTFNKMGLLASNGKGLSAYAIAHALENNLSYVEGVVHAFEQHSDVEPSRPTFLKTLNKVSENDQVIEYVSPPLAGEMELSVAYPKYRYRSDEVNSGPASANLLKCEMRRRKSATADSEIEGLDRLFYSDRVMLCETVIKACKRTESVLNRIRALRDMNDSKQAELAADMAKTENAQEYVQAFLWNLSNGLNIQLKAINILYGYLLSYMLVVRHYVEQSTVPAKKEAASTESFEDSAESIEISDTDACEMLTDLVMEGYDTGAEEISMEASNSDLKNGKRVKYSHGHGKIVKVYTAPFKFGGKHHAADKDNPRYLVKDDKTHKFSLHKASALKV